MNWFFFAVVLVAIFLFSGFTNLVGPENFIFNKSVADTVKAKYQSIANNNNLFLYATPNDALAIICVETGSFVLKGETSQSIPFGDSNKSIGLMQVKQTTWNNALMQDSNSALNNLKDLTNDSNNILAGLVILDKCFVQNNGNRLLAYQCYNNGIHKKEYANAVMNYYNYFEGK